MKSRNEDAVLVSTLAALDYVRKFQGKTILIKLGGAALEDEKLVTQLCNDIRLIQSVGVRVVIVHGGGPAINEELKKRNISWEFINGLRVTTPMMMDVIEMVLVGKVNHRMVRLLNRAGVKAVGLSGADSNLLFCTQADKQLQQVGLIQKIDPSSVHSILNMNKEAVPVIAPVGVGKKGEAYNINADWAAVRLAEALNIKKVLFLTDQDGILDSQKQLIQDLDAAELEGLIEHGVVQGGMLAKVQTVLHALRNGVTDVHIMNARRPHALIEELFTSRGVGTLCRLRSLEAHRQKNQRSLL
jgi:acetylglutamate kinase